MLSASAQTTTSLITATIDSTGNSPDLQVGDEFNLLVSYRTASVNNAFTGILDSTSDTHNIGIRFNFLNNLYTEIDDLDTSSPRLHFNNGLLTSLFYRTDLTKSLYPQGSFIIFYPDNSIEYSLDASSEFSGSYTITQNSIMIPELETSTLLAISAIFIIFRRKQ